jgi:hypothetical protein
MSLLFAVYSPDTPQAPPLLTSLVLRLKLRTSQSNLHPFFDNMTELGAGWAPTSLRQTFGSNSNPLKILPVSAYFSRILRTVEVLSALFPKI